MRVKCVLGISYRYNFFDTLSKNVLLCAGDFRPCTIPTGKERWRERVCTRYVTYGGSVAR